MSKHGEKSKRSHDADKRIGKAADARLIPADIAPIIASAIAAMSEPSERDFVTILLDEYTDLVAQRTLLDAVKRMIERDRYSKYDDMRAVLGMEPAPVPQPRQEDKAPADGVCECANKSADKPSDATEKATDDEWPKGEDLS